eukprot:TRINITY_DN33201_c0_g1_i1.p1 TRINITY_DN33201_c0_g1~~TRINITY_DN33201_c0_g1_i1.p1  ORF type:complete len:175 (+),score=28.01 TRINITY_DN33201_c0_g1_i1:163-687(+)
MEEEGDSAAGHLDMPPELRELLLLRLKAIKKVVPGAPDELLRKICRYLQVSEIVLGSPCGSRYWWSGRYVIEAELGSSAGMPLSRCGRRLLYRWRACADTRPRAAGARSRACETAAREGEEEWRIASQTFQFQIVRARPHEASLVLAGPLRSSGDWIEVTREFRESREVLVSFN